MIDTLMENCRYFKFDEDVGYSRIIHTRQILSECGLAHLHQMLMFIGSLESVTKVGLGLCIFSFFLRFLFFFGGGGGREEKL